MTKEGNRPEDTVGIKVTRHQRRLGRYRDSDTAPTPEILAEKLEGARADLSVSREELRTQSEEIAAAAHHIEIERARYLELFEAAPDAYIITDVNGVVREANRAAAKLCGVPPARLAGKPFAVFVDDDDRAAFRTALLRVARYESLPERDLRIVARDGRVHTVSTHAVGVSGRTRGDTEIRWLLRDVSHRVQAEEAIRRLRWEQAARKASEAAERRAIFLANASRSLLEVQGVDATVERIVDLAVPVLGVHAVLHIVDPHGGLLAIAASHADGDGRRAPRSGVGERIAATDHGSVARVARMGEAEIVDGTPDTAGADGSSLDMLLPLRGHDHVLGVLSVRRGDAAADEMNPLALGEAFASHAAAALERALLLDQIVAARAEAERANAEKARFLSVFSHEIRTPLSATLGYIELMLDGIPEPLPQGLIAHAKGIDASVRHQLGLVDQILQFAHIHSAREEPKSAGVDLAALLHDVATIVRPAADARGLALHVRAADSPVVVTTDEGRLRQAVLNIANNAVRFTEQGNVTLALDGDGEGTVLVVRDTGPGIPAEDLDHIFDTFWRGASSAGRWPAGMGLGLAIARELVADLRGEIDVTSATGRGTEFRIRLPAAGAERSTSIAGEAPPKP